MFTHPNTMQSIYFLPQLSTRDSINRLKLFLNADNIDQTQIHLSPSLTVPSLLTDADSLTLFYFHSHPWKKS